MATPAPAGLSTSTNSALLQATLPGGSPLFSNPLLFNNIFWDNRAGTRGRQRDGHRRLGDARRCDHWDLGVADGPRSAGADELDRPAERGHASVHRRARPTSAADPQVVTPYDVGVTFNTWRNNPAFLGAIMISADLPPNLLGNYHLQATSPAINAGAASKAPVSAPAVDIDNTARPARRRASTSAPTRSAVVAPPPPPPPPTTGTVSVQQRLAGHPQWLDAELRQPWRGTTNVEHHHRSPSSGAAVQFGNVTVQGGNGNRFSEVNSGTCQGTTRGRRQPPARSSSTSTRAATSCGPALLTVTHNGTGSPATLTLTGQ